MRIAGEILVVNLMDLDPAPGARAVVIGWDKTILVEDMSDARSNRTFLGDRNFLLPDPVDKTFPRSVYAVGMVVASQPATAPTKSVPAKIRPAGGPNKFAKPAARTEALRYAAILGTA